MAKRPQQAQSEEPTRPIVRDYFIIGVTALLIITLILLQGGLGWWSVMPLAIGASCLLARWVIGPLLVLLVLIFLQALRAWLMGFPSWYRAPSEPLVDLLLAVSVLAYVAGHMRLLSLERHAVPPDVRQERRPPGIRAAGRWMQPRAASRRSSTWTSPTEITRLLAAAPIFALIGSLLWVRLAVEPPPDWLDVPAALWHTVVIIWAAALALGTAYAFLAWLGRSQAGGEESQLYLQDQLWAQTRGEQRRINRWVVWGRLRRQRKEETS